MRRLFYLNNLMTVTSISPPNAFATLRVNQTPASHRRSLSPIPVV